jgi:hypothetical protein
VGSHIALDDRGDALAAADAQHGEQRRGEARALELVEGGAEQDGPGRAERVAERDRAAVDVDALGVDLEVRGWSAAARGEGLVDLPQVDVASPSCRRARGPLRRGRGRREHDDGLGARRRHRADARARRAPCAFTTSSLASSTAQAPSTMPLELPAVCRCSILRPRVALQRELIERLAVRGPRRRSADAS